MSGSRRRCFLSRVSRRRYRARARDALDRRSHGPRPLVRPRLRQEPARRRTSVPRSDRCSFRCAMPTSRASFERSKQLLALGFKIRRRGAPRASSQAHDVPAVKINKVSEGQPVISPTRSSNGSIQLVLQHDRRGPQALADFKPCGAPPSCIRPLITPPFSPRLRRRRA